MKKISVILLQLLLFSYANSQLQNNVVSIRTILDNPLKYSEAFIKIAGTVSNVKLLAIQKGHMFYTTFTVSDNSDSISVIAFTTTIKEKDSISVIGKFLAKRMIGQYVVGVNEIDAYEGQIEILKGGYLNATTESSTDDNNFVSVDQIETPSTRISTYATIVGIIITLLTLIPVLLTKRRFNIDLKISSLRPPEIIKLNSAPNKSICIELTVYNLKLLPPEINSNIYCKIGNTHIVPQKIVDEKNNEIKFPLRIERSTILNLFFNYDTCIQHFARDENFSVILKDEFSNKKFKQKFKFNFIIPADDNA